MNETAIIDTLEAYFKAELSNKVEKKGNGFIFALANGTVAMVKVIGLPKMNLK